MKAAIRHVAPGISIENTNKGFLKVKNCNLCKNKTDFNRKFVNKINDVSGLV